MAIAARLQVSIHASVFRYSAAGFYPEYSIVI